MPGFLRSGLVQFEIVKPRHLWIDAFFFEVPGQILNVLFPPAGVGGVVRGDDDGIVLDPPAAFQTAEEVLGQM